MTISAGAVTHSAVMQRAGSGSWRFAAGVEQAPALALFARDAGGLAVPPGPGVPPPLDGQLPEVSAELDARGRALAGSAWWDWWRAIIAHAVAGQRGAPPCMDQRSWVRRMITDGIAVFDPPEFASLSDRPALQQAVRATLPAALAWVATDRRPLGGSIASFDYQLIRQAAVQIGRRRQVSPAALSACAVLIPVQGRWWHQVEPGAVVCSVTAASDTDTARRVLDDVFESGLAS